MQTMQCDLFGQDVPRGLFRRTDPQTSRIAASRLVESGALGRQAQAVLEAVQANPGSTAVEIAQRAGIDRYAVSRRLPELQRKGKVRRGPPRDCRVNGRPQSTWRVA